MARAKKDNVDFIPRCAPMTGVLMGCMHQHPDYYTVQVGCHVVHTLLVLQENHVMDDDDNSAPVCCSALEFVLSDVETDVSLPELLSTRYACVLQDDAEDDQQDDTTSNSSSDATSNPSGEAAGDGEQRANAAENVGAPQ